MLHKLLLPASAALSQESKSSVKYVLYDIKGNSWLCIAVAGLQACHELVPPDAMTAVLRQLVDAFVHDRARPEVMTLGLKTVRELCARMPLIMSTDLLQVISHAAGHGALAADHVSIDSVIKANIGPSPGLSTWYRSQVLLGKLICTCP